MRSLLFVPADGGAKLDKAVRSGADAVIVDLEDSIAPEGKAAARASAADFLEARGAARSSPAPAGAGQRSRDRADRRRPRRHSAGAARRRHAAEGRRRRQRGARRRQARRPRGDRRTARRPHRDPRDCDRDRRGIVRRRQLLRARARGFWGLPGARRICRPSSAPRPTGMRRGASSTRTGSRASSASPPPLPPRCRRSTPSWPTFAISSCCAARRHRPVATASPARWRSIPPRSR